MLSPHKPPPRSAAEPPGCGMMQACGARAAPRARLSAEVSRGPVAWCEPVARAQRPRVRLSAQCAAPIRPRIARITRLRYPRTATALWHGANLWRARSALGLDSARRLGWLGWVSFATVCCADPSTDHPCPRCTPQPRTAAALWHGATLWRARSALGLDSARRLGWLGWVSFATVFCDCRATTRVLCVGDGCV